MNRPLVLLTVALACASCSRQTAEPSSPADLALTAPPGMKHKAYADDEVVAAPAADAAAAPAREPPQSGVQVPAGAPMLAYSYEYSVSLPGRQVDALRRRHERACADAGPTVCQVVSTSIADRGDGAVRGVLSMRAAPSWLKRFRDGLESDAKDAGGRIETSDVTSEDLSREIVDTEAQLRAKTTLRDRLQGLLAGRPGRLADLLEVERELARVQGEIDSTQSQLAVMRGRVAMSEINLAYQARDMVGSPVRSPLSRSLGGFFGAMAASLAAIIDIVALTAPWAVLVAGVLWLLRRRLPKLGRRAAAPSPPPAG